MLLAGTSGIVIGALTFFNPGATRADGALLYRVVGDCHGIVEIVAAVQLRNEIEGEFWASDLGGLISIAFGVFLVAKPGAGALAVLWLIASYAILFGTIQILLAFEARSFAKRLTGVVVLDLRRLVGYDRCRATRCDTATTMPPLDRPSSSLET